MSAAVAVFALNVAVLAPAVEEQVKATLVARVEAYRAKGLSGIAPYARSDGQRFKQLRPDLDDAVPA